MPRIALKVLSFACCGWISLAGASDCDDVLTGPWTHLQSLVQSVGAEKADLDSLDTRSDDAFMTDVLRRFFLRSGLDWEALNKLDSAADSGQHTPEMSSQLAQIAQTFLEKKYEKNAEAPLTVAQAIYARRMLDLQKTFTRLEKGLPADPEREEQRAKRRQEQQRQQEQKDRLQSRSQKPSDQKKENEKSKPGDCRSGDGKPGDCKSGDGKPGDDKPGDGKPGDGKPGDGKPGDGKPGDGKPGDGKPGDGKPGDDKPGDGKPGDGKPGDGKLGDDKPGDGKPGDDKPGDGKPGDGKPGDGKPGDGKPGDGKPGDGKPGDGKPGDGKPGDGKPGDGKPGDGKPGDGKPGDGKPGDGKPGDGKPGDGKPGDGKPGDGKPGDGKPGDGKPGDGKPGDGKPGDGKPGDGKPGDGKPGDGKPGDGKPGDGKPGDGKPGDGQGSTDISKIMDAIRKAAGREPQPNSQSDAGAGKNDPGTWHPNSNGQAQANEIKKSEPAPTHPFDELKTADEVDAALRFMYRIELMKFGSSRQMRNGLQNFINILQGSDNWIDPNLRVRFIAAASTQLQRLDGFPIHYTDLIDFNTQLETALIQGRKEDALELVVGLRTSLDELARYQALESTAAELRFNLNQLIVLIGHSPSEPDDTVLAKKMLKILPGDLSRQELQVTFGKNIALPGSADQRNFVAALQSGKLWSYHLSGLLVPYLSIHLRKHSTSRPNYFYGPQASLYGEGDHEIAYTDEASMSPLFVVEEGFHSMLNDLSEGSQKFLGHEILNQTPVVVDRVPKTTSVLIYDGSGSMGGNRAIIRNMILASFVDHHYSSLASPLQQSNSKAPAAHTIYHFWFTTELGEVKVIRDRKQAREYIRDMNQSPEANTDGGTMIEQALVRGLQLILKSKKENRGELQYANIVLVSDGDDANVNSERVTALRREIGPDTIISVSVILIEGDNSELRKIAAASHRSENGIKNPGEGFHFKRIDGDLMRNLIAKSKKTPDIEEYDLWRVLPQTDRVRDIDVRSALKQVLHSATRQHTAKAPTNSAKATLQEWLRINRSTITVHDPKTLQRTDDMIFKFTILLRRLYKLDVPPSMRAAFILDVVQHAVRSQNISLSDFVEVLSSAQYANFKTILLDWIQDHGGRQ